MKNTFFNVGVKLIGLIVTVGFLLRIILGCVTPGSLGIGFGGWLAVMGLGIVNDLCVGTLSLAFMWLYLISINDRKYNRISGTAILALLVAAFAYVCCFNTVFDEYGSVVPLIARILLGYWAASFALRLFVKKVRRVWTLVWFWILAVTYVFIIYFNAAGEFFFWDEFNVRYNFIAVDYLIYTNEVVGNIMESYAMVPLIIVTAIVTGITAWLLFRSTAHTLPNLRGGRWRLPTSVVYLVACGLAVGLLSLTSRASQSDNAYYNELQANGVERFIDAFRKNHLDYVSFYYSLDPAEAEAAVRRLYGSHDHNIRHIAADSTAVWAPGSRPNIVLITMESMSASFMERYGDDRGITPNLDSLAAESLVFDCMIATGNRTVRGLEALSLSLPPCPGESIVKRPDCSGMPTVGRLLGSKGYQPFYFYGGNAYFDNMGTYFGGNGYEVVDVKSYKPEEITFQNIWGVADEDAFRKVINTLDGLNPELPFFAHVMTISNHRPYTYPEGRIPIPTDSKTRAGGVMYADYAIGEFIREARNHPWFNNTVFVIVADHCASSAGKTELPVEKYHIPAMIYAPGRIAPKSIDMLCSQIDLMPTLFALIGMDYDSGFYGRNILSTDFTPRAFLATYENLGYLENDTLTVLSPVKRIEQFRLVPTADNPFNTEPVEVTDSTLIKRAAALYQSSTAWY